MSAVEIFQALANGQQINDQYGNVYQFDDPFLKRKIEDDRWVNGSLGVEYLLSKPHLYRVVEE